MKEPIQKRRVFNVKGLIVKSTQNTWKLLWPETNVDKVERLSTTWPETNVDKVERLSTT